MFIAKKVKKRTKLRRSEIFSWQALIKRANNMSLLRSLCLRLDSPFYKYFVPTGLVCFILGLTLCATFVINSRASESRIESSGANAISRRARLFEVSAQQQKSFAPALPALPSSRHERAASQTSRRVEPSAVRRMSRAAVFKFRESYLHHLSYGREIGSIEIVPAPEEL